jgi:hypothetical protein
MVTTPVEGKSSLHSKASSSRSPRLSLQGYNRYLILWIAPLYNGLLDPRMPKQISVLNLPGAAVCS